VTISGGESEERNEKANVREEENTPSSKRRVARARIGTPGHTIEAKLNTGKKAEDSAKKQRKEKGRKERAARGVLPKTKPALIARERWGKTT